MRTSSRAHIVLLLTLSCALAAATASAQDIFYLRSSGLLSPAAPPAGATTVLLSMSIPPGEDVLLGSFTSAPAEQDLVAGEARGIVYLGTGRPGMDGCARVTTSLVRQTGAVQTGVATGTLVTTLRSRKNTTVPVIVPMAIADPLVAATGDRLVFHVRVANDCGGERNVSLMFDSFGRASRLELLVPGVTTTTTSTTTTLPVTCLDNAAGLAAVRCRLEAMDTILRHTSPALLGGVHFTDRLSRRVDRALTFVRASELQPTPRRLRKGRHQLSRFSSQLSRGRADGRVAPEVGDTLGALAEGATTSLEAFIFGG